MKGRFASALASGRFVLTTEVSPPRDTLTDRFAMDLDAARHAVAVNITDNPGARLHASPLAGVALAIQAGVEPIVQVVCRNCNVLAILSDVLGAWLLGARSIVVLTGDPPSIGEFPSATPVHDLDSIQLIGVIKALRDTGALPNGRVLVDPPRYVIGTTDAPLALPPAESLPRLVRKVEAGADFVQTQPVFDLPAFEAWLAEALRKNLPGRVRILAGVAVIRSAAAARRWQALPGAAMPPALVDRFASAGDPEALGIALALETIDRLRVMPGVAGVHLMGAGWRAGVEQVIDRSGLAIEPDGPTIASFPQGLPSS